MLLPCSVLAVAGKCVEEDVSMFRYNIQDIVDELEVFSSAPEPCSMLVNASKMHCSPTMQ